MDELRCPGCKKLFFKYMLKGSLIVEVKCKRCNRVMMIKDIKN